MEASLIQDMNPWELKKAYEKAKGSGYYLDPMKELLLKCGNLPVGDVLEHVRDLVHDDKLTWDLVVKFVHDYQDPILNEYLKSQNDSDKKLARKKSGLWRTPEEFQAMSMCCNEHLARRLCKDSFYSLAVWITKWLSVQSKNSSWSIIDYKGNDYRQLVEIKPNDYKNSKKVEISHSYTNTTIYEECYYQDDDEMESPYGFGSYTFKRGRTLQDGYVYIRGDDNLPKDLEKLLVKINNEVAKGLSWI